MAPVEYIRHDYLGAMHVTALCDDKDCHTQVGAKILFVKHNGYESQGAKEISEADRKKADDAIAGHNRNHSMRLIIGHHSETDEATGNSKTIYEYKAKGSKHG